MKPRRNTLFGRTLVDKNQRFDAIGVEGTIMLDVTCDLFADGNLAATNLVVWLPIKEGPSHEGRFRVPTNFEVLTGARYHLELLGEKAKLMKMPAGHSMDIIITEVADQVAHFTRVSAAR
jgi:hypothetical protein